MPSRAEYDVTLTTLAELLKREPMTARAIAERFNCCRPVAYQRLAALEKRGAVLYRVEHREAVRGPKSVAYGIR